MNKALESILSRHEGNPIKAAREVVGRFESADNFGALASEWCQCAERILRTDPSTANTAFNETEAPAIHRLLLATCSADTLFLQWVLLTKERTSALKGDPDGLMKALLACWSHRESPTKLGSEVIQWTSSTERKICTPVALALYEYPEVAYAVLGPIPPPPDPSSPCDSCGKVHEKATHQARYWPYLELRETRAEKGCPEHELDTQCLLNLPTEFLTGHVVVARSMRSMLQLGVEIPDRFFDAAGKHMYKDWEHFAAAYLLFTATEPRRSTALARLAQWIKGAAELHEWFAHPQVHHQFLHYWSGIFTGPGLGRDNRPSKLLPVSRAFLEKQYWPTEHWERWLHRRESADSAESKRNQPYEPNFENVREVLAEALLSYALATDECVRVREGAIEAIGILVPGGNGSVGRALSKVERPSLREKAKTVQKRLSKHRSQLPAAEFAIEDALIPFFECLQKRPAHNGHANAIGTGATTPRQGIVIR